MFTYKDYYEMVSLLLEDNRTIFFRHDVDISLERAVEMAEREQKLNLMPTTYFILLSSSFYNPFSKDGRRNIDRIINMGHTIGLHYDLSLVNNDEQAQAKYILWQRSLLEAEFDIEVTLCSVHKPNKNGPVTRELGALLQIAGINDVNITMPHYKYISDSGMNWREDYHEIVKQYKKIHLNAHPVWYDEKEGDYKDRLHSLRLDLVGDKLINEEIQNICDYREKMQKSS